MKEKQQNIKSILPELTKIHQSRIHNYKVEVYEGKEGIKTHFENIYNDVETDNAKTLALFGTTGKADALLQYYFPQLVKRAQKLISQNKLKARTLRNSNLNNKKISSMSLPQKYKYLSKNNFNK